MTNFKDWFDGLSDTTKHVIDGLSITTTVAALFQMLPHIAALLSVIWGVIRIYETRTVQQLLGKKPPRNRKDDE